MTIAIVSTAILSGLWGCALIGFGIALLKA